MESDLVIYRSTERDLQAEEALTHAFARVQAFGGKVRRRDYPTAYGQLAGAAIEVLLSPPVQAFINAVEIGSVLWLLVRAARTAGWRIRVSKQASKSLAAAKVAEELRLKLLMSP